MCRTKNLSSCLSNISALLNSIFSFLTIRYLPYVVIFGLSRSSLPRFYLFDGDFRLLTATFSSVIDIRIQPSIENRTESCSPLIRSHGPNVVRGLVRHLRRYITRSFIRRSTLKNDSSRKNWSMTYDLSNDRSRRRGAEREREKFFRLAFLSMRFVSSYRSIGLCLFLI